MSGRAKKRKNAGEGYGYMFHGSFGTKAKAKAKEEKTKGAWIKPTLTNKGYRYIVMSPRTNPIKRKKHNPDETLKKAIAAFKKLERLEAQGKTDRAWKLRRQLAKLNTRLDMSMAQLAEHARGQNPHELLVLGANPSATSRDITVPPGSTITIRMNPTELRENVELGTYENGIFHPWTRRPKSRQKEAIRRQNTADSNPDRFTSAHAIASGARYTPPALIQTKRQKRVAGMVRKARKHRYEWIPTEGIAPGMNNPSAAVIREDFTGMPAEHYTVHSEPHMPAGDYAQLGELLALYVKPLAGGQVQAITFEKPRPILVSDETARQLYFVDGDQDLASALDLFGARDRGAGLFELGEARRIDYKQRKEHVRDPHIDEWRHEFGEETGVHPRVLYDSKHKRLLLEGGEYQIRPEGIVN